MCQIITQAKVSEGELMNAPLGYIGDTPAQRLIPAQPIVRLEKVSKTFPGRDGQPVTALREIDLAVPQGSILGVIGRSGAGKSTLIRLVNGLEKPTSGKVIVDGADIAALPEAALRHARRSIGMIFQHFNLLSSRTAAQNIALPLEVAGFDKAEIRTRVEELARPRRPLRQAQPLSVRALRRPEAARRHCPRARHQAEGAALRRGDLGARPGDHPVDPRPARAHQ